MSQLYSLYCLLTCAAQAPPALALRSYSVDQTWSIPASTSYYGPQLSSLPYCWDEVTTDGQQIFANIGYPLGAGSLQLIQFYTKGPQAGFEEVDERLTFFVMALISNRTVTVKGNKIVIYTLNVTYRSEGVTWRKVEGFHSVRIENGPSANERPASYIGWTFQSHMVICHGPSARPSDAAASAVTPAAAYIRPGDIYEFSVTANSSLPVQYAIGAVMGDASAGPTNKSTVIDATYVRFNIADTSTWPSWFLPSMIAGAVLIAVVIVAVLMKLLRNHSAHDADDEYLARAISRTIVTQLADASPKQPQPAAQAAGDQAMQPEKQQQQQQQAQQHSKLEPQQQPQPSQPPSPVRSTSKSGKEVTSLSLSGSAPPASRSTSPSSSRRTPNMDDVSNASASLNTVDSPAPEGTSPSLALPEEASSTSPVRKTRRSSSSRKGRS